MGKNIDKKTIVKAPNPNEKLKVEAAKELGLFDKVKRIGWNMLTAQETGKIGAVVKKKLRNCKINS
jgi:hypothetical protein